MSTAAVAVRDEVVATAHRLARARIEARLASMLLAPGRLNYSRLARQLRDPAEFVDRVPMTIAETVTAGETASAEGAPHPALADRREAA